MSPRTSASGPRWPSFSGLITDRTVWTTPCAMSRAKTLTRRPPSSTTMAPGWPFTCRRRISTPAETNCRAEPISRRATRSGPTIGFSQDGPSAVPVDDHVVGEQLDQSVHVAVGDRGEEAFGELVALPPGRFEPRSLRFDMATGAHGELPAVRLGLSDDLGDFVVAVAEHVVEQKDRPLDGAEPFQEHEERHRKRVRLLGVRRRVLTAVVGHERLRQPWPDVGLPSGARLRRADFRPVLERALMA